MRVAADNPSHVWSQRAFRVAVGFLVLTAVLGTVLRGQAWKPVDWAPPYGYLLHTHSHVAFLGWVFNAFWAVAALLFIPREKLAGQAKIFLICQLAVVGMLITYPIQGYGAVSISFSTLHMVAAGVFAWRLWRNNTARPAARRALNWALGFLVISGIGPLALGPLAAAGLRDAPAYLLSIYYYLHCQYNGWFVMFLVAAFLQLRPAEGRSAADERRASRAIHWLGAGVLLTLAQSALWLDPPLIVRLIGALGGIAQLIGAVELMRSAGGLGFVRSRLARGLWLGAWAACLVKFTLQLGSVWPGIAVWVNHRFMVIAFLHLVFLGVVTPVLFAWAIEAGHVRAGKCLSAGLVIFLGAAIATELLLVALTLGMSVSGQPGAWFFAAACAMVVGAALLFSSTTFLRPSR